MVQLYHIFEVQTVVSAFKSNSGPFLKQDQPQEVKPCGLWASALPPAWHGDLGKRTPRFLSSFSLKRRCWQMGAAAAVVLGARKCSAHVIFCPHTHLSGLLSVKFVRLCRIQNSTCLFSIRTIMDRRKVHALLTHLQLPYINQYAHFGIYASMPFSLLL